MPDVCTRPPTTPTLPALTDAAPRAETPLPQQTPVASYDPNAVTYRMEAWMPDAIASYKLRGGKRIFRMAPLHHHFELGGWSESKVIARFWIMALVFALFALTTLKLR